MKVSIITPSFNSAHTIRDTLESVRNQSFPSVEHLVIDGASHDNTLDIVQKFNGSVQCFSEPDKGIYDAMNKGIRKAAGDVIGILNSDDFYSTPEVLAEVAALFEEKDCDAVYGDLVYVDNKDINKVVRRWNAGPFRSSKFLYGWMPPHPTFFVRRQVYEKYGVFDTSLKTSADYELMLRFLYRYQIQVAYLPQCLVCMRTGGQSNASLKHRLDANREDRLAWKINGLKPRFYTTILKPIHKIPQFLT
jgi:glycosyltransferase